MKKEFAPFRQVLRNLVKQLPQNGRVLDIGCGSGKTLIIIKEMRPDISLSALDMSYAPQEGVEFYQGHVEELTKYFKENTFDAVICQHVIEHLVYPTEMMRQSKKVLKNNGKIYVETPNWPCLFTPFHSRIYFWSDPTHVHPYSKETLRRLFKEERFETEIVSSCRGRTVLVRDLLIAVGVNKK